jgi:hypothetical protein
MPDQVRHDKRKIESIIFTIAVIPVPKAFGIEPGSSDFDLIFKA